MGLAEHGEECGNREKGTDVVPAVWKAMTMSLGQGNQEDGLVWGT